MLTMLELLLLVMMATAMSHWASSNSSGYVSDTIMPGSWTLSLEKETSDKKWTINQGDYIFDATQKPMQILVT